MAQSTAGLFVMNMTEQPFRVSGLLSAMVRFRSHEEVDLRSRAKAVGYDVFDLDTGFALAKRLSGGRRELVLGGDGGVSLDTIGRWLDENHPQ
jgi:hypothetical protein